MSLSSSTSEEKMAATVAKFVDASLPRVVLVLGATGAGKSKLAIELAQRFDGEVISADSMQLYAGLEIATNKVTPAEAQGIPHHMLGFLSPLTIGYTVFNFRTQAVPLLADIWRRKRLPIIVGGTNYYIESLVWDLLIGDTDKIDPSKAADLAERELSLCNFSDGVPAELLAKTTPELHAELAKIDPAQAAQLHPNNRRKVLRSLQIWFRSGRRQSDFLLAQRSLDDGRVTSVGGRMLYETVALWLRCEPDVLDRRIDMRCDEMVVRGLREEVSEFYDQYYQEYARCLREFGAHDSTKGLFQSIGLKEFLPFCALSRDERESEKGGRLFDAGVVALKVRTKQYARKQERWVRSRFLRKPSRPTPPVFALDANDPSAEAWAERVRIPAERIVADFIARRPFSADTPLPVEEDAFELERNTIFECATCSLTISGRAQWEAHLASRKHYRKRRALSDLATTLGARATRLTAAEVRSSTSSLDEEGGKSFLDAL